MPDLTQIAESMRLVYEDCATDAHALDRTPFTPRGVGEALGTTLAMVAAVAKAVEGVAAEIEADRRVLDSRTGHLA